jgi:toxin-antitoxin system PIN domain toxin
VRSLLDVALLIALLQEHHAHYDRAHDWWAVNRTEGWASCPLTQNGFLRIVPQLHFPKPAAAPDPFHLLSDMIAATNHEFWPDDISLLDEAIIDRSRVLGPKQLTDIYLLALAVRHGGRLVTFDRAIPLKAVRGAEADHLVVV